MNVPNELKYTKDHEWISIEDDVATIGITEFAQGELGDIVYVEVETVEESLMQKRFSELLRLSKQFLICLCLLVER